MFQKAKDFFTYNHNERKGIIAISFLVLLIIGGITAYRYWSPDENFDFSRISALSDSLEARKLRNEYNNSSADSFNKKDDAWRKPEKISPFDPNTIDDSSWIDLGFSDRQIKTLRNYMKSGAEFRSKQDFKKLYFVDDSIYDILSPYILLPEKESKKWNYNKWDNESEVSPKIKWSDTANYNAYEYKKLLVDLNTADTTEIDEIKWIGPYYAREIVKYRNALGGYYNKAQLLEIWSFTPGKIDTIAEFITIDISQIRKININRATAQDLSKHPYINFKTANAIVNCRIKNGDFKSMADLAKCNLVNAEIRRKIAAYLSFN